MLFLRQTEDIEQIVPVLVDALPFEDRLRAELSSPELTVYAAMLDEELIGAVAVRWVEPSEIALLGVDTAMRGHGHGQAIVGQVVEEARRRGFDRILVGTASFSLDNILFYQKCGFRMSHVRRDHFPTAFPDIEPIIWRGITLKDMIVFEFALRSEA
jgi:GNAT superfamily N-acetyltransferase